jgi:hypothetical protein
MSFLHLWMIWLLPLALLPIILHLLTLHRLKTVELSTFRFLFDSYIQQRRRMRFLEALIAMLRALFLLLLVLLFARAVYTFTQAPFAGQGGGSSGREVLLLVDCSASMSARHEGVSAIDRAKIAALEIARQFGPGDKITVVRVAGRAEEVVSRFNTDPEALRGPIEALQPTSTRANFFAAASKLFGPEAPKRANPIVYFFTDCQANTWKEARDQGLAQLLPDKLPFVLVNVAPPARTTFNVAVTGTAPRPNRVIAGLPIVLRPRITNFSTTEPAELTLSTFIDDKEVASQQITVPAGQTIVKAIDYTPTEAGLRRGRFEVKGRTADRFPDDDRFLFTLDVQPRVKVLLVNGHHDEDERRDEAHYLYLALTSRAHKEDEEKKAGQPTTREILRSLDVRKVIESEVTDDALKGTSVVVLANCGALTDAQFKSVRDFVRDGGGLLIFPGDRVTPVRYNAFLSAGLRADERLTDAVLEAPVGAIDKVETFDGIEVDVSHPALSIFDNPGPDVRPFKTVLVYRRFVLSLPKKHSNAVPLARFTRGRTPALIQGGRGDGIVLLSAFPPHARWGNLVFKPDFVPLVLRLVAHAQHHPDVEVPAVVTADSAAEVTVNANWAPAEATVRGPAGPPVALALKRKDVGPLLGVFDQTSRQGYYTVKVVSSRAGAVKATEVGFAVNLAPEESEVRALDEKELRKLLPSKTELTFLDGSDATKWSQAARQGQAMELWPFLIAVAFVVIGVEFMLSTLSGRKREDEEGPSVTERVLEVSTGGWVGRMTGAAEKKGE